MLGGLGVCGVANKYLAVICMVDPHISTLLMKNLVTSMARLT